MKKCYFKKAIENYMRVDTKKIEKNLRDIYIHVIQFPAPEDYQYVTINSRQINHFYGASFTFCNIVKERSSEFMLS